MKHREIPISFFEKSVENRNIHSGSPRTYSCTGTPRSSVIDSLLPLYWTGDGVVSPYPTGRLVHFRSCSDFIGVGVATAGDGAGADPTMETITTDGRDAAAPDAHTLRELSAATPTPQPARAQHQWSTFQAGG